MLTTSLLPVNKCIVTDYLQSTKLAHYTSGYLVYIEGIQNDIDVLCSMLVTSAGGKLSHRPSLTKIRTPVVFFDDLVKTGVYGKSSCFLLVDTTNVSYLDLKGVDFINMLYARIVSLNRISCNYFNNNVLVNNNPTIKKFFQDYNAAAKVHSKAMVEKVNTSEKRVNLIHNMLLLESFIKKNLPQPVQNMNFLQRAYTVARDYERKATHKKIEALLKNKDCAKILSDNQENKDALHRYKNSGYWL